MAVAPLNLSAEHQAWFSSGLGFLLLDCPTAELVAQCNRLVMDAARTGAQSGAGVAVGSTTAAYAAPGASAFSGAPGSFAASGEARPDQPFMPGSAGNAAGSYNVGRGSLPAGNVAPNAQAAAAQAGSPQAASIYPAYEFSADNLPAAWKGILQKVAPGPVVWIYPELGLDLQGLSGAEGAKRSAALRSIIGSLKLKKGTNSFWPVSVEGFENSGNGKVERALFHGGLDYLGAKYLIIFGPSALSGTDFEDLRLRPFTEQVCRGRLIIALPDFTELVSDQARLQSVTVFLHSIFSRVF